MNRFCIYRHIRLDTNKVFYIGIGNTKRPRIKSDRSQFWKNITNKTEYEIQILKSDLTWEEACELEIILISYYGRIDNKTGILVNLTNGGMGGNGIIVSKKTKKLQSKIQKNNPIAYWKNKKLSKEHVENMIKNSGMAKKIICIKTGKIWSSSRQCALDNNFCYSSFAQKMNGLRTNKTTFKFLENGK